MTIGISKWEVEVRYTSTVVLIEYYFSHSLQADRCHEVVLADSSSFVHHWHSSSAVWWWWRCLQPGRMPMRYCWQHISSDLWMQQPQTQSTYRSFLFKPITVDWIRRGNFNDSRSCRWCFSITWVSLKRKIKTSFWRSKTVNQPCFMTLWTWNSSN